MPSLSDLRTSILDLSHEDGLALIMASQQSRLVSSQRTIREREEKQIKTAVIASKKAVSKINPNQAALLLALLGDIKE